MATTAMKFLIDVGVGKKVEEWLAESGYDVKTVRRIDPRAKDADILKLAVSEKRMVITMDKDFGELVFRSGKAHAGILILRLEDATGSEKAAVLKNIMGKYSDSLYGKFCVYHAGKLRIHR